MQDFCACVLRDSRFQNDGHNTVDNRCCSKELNNLNIRDEWQFVRP